MPDPVVASKPESFNMFPVGQGGVALGVGVGVLVGVGVGVGVGLGGVNVGVADGASGP